MYAAEINTLYVVEKTETCESYCLAHPWAGRSNKKATCIRAATVVYTLVIQNNGEALKMNF